MNAPQEKYTVVRHVDAHERQLWLLWGFIPTNRKDGVTQIGQYANQGDAVVNVCIREKYDFIDWLIQNWTTFIIGVPGITNSLKVEVTGDVIRYAN